MFYNSDIDNLFLLTKIKWYNYYENLYKFGDSVEEYIKNNLNINNLTIIQPSNTNSRDYTIKLPNPDNLIIKTNQTLCIKYSQNIFYRANSIYKSPQEWIGTGTFIEEL